MDWVVVDTNVLGKERPLASNAVERLLAEAREGHVKLAVPTLVIDELINGWIEDIGQIERDLQRSIGRLRAKGAAPEVTPAPIDLTDLRSRERARVLERLGDAGAVILPYPEVPHATVVRRALDRRLPFDSAGKDGYRDTLLWETVKELAGGHHVIFASRDASAFYENGLDSPMAGSLVNELVVVGRQSAVELFASLDDALDKALDRREAAEERKAARREVRRVTDALNAILHENNELLQQLFEEIAVATYVHEFSSRDRLALDLPRSVHAIELEELESQHSLELLSVRPLTDRVLAEVSAYSLVSLRVTLPPDEAASLDEQDAMVVDHGGIGRDARVTALRSLTAVYEATFSEDLAEVRDVRLIRIKRQRA